MELLWTDQCFLGVLIISLIITLISLRKAHTRQAFKRIFRRPLAVSAGIVLCFFLLLALSIPFI